ncbi:phage antirepressor KilAC domain-containing protein [Microcella sp.]|uniref:phage antirepressor KilAC domain-containing protein n=1 Tax=Microcella sp. TaxID=1913979 RepID=UPI00391BE4E4
MAATMIQTPVIVPLRWLGRGQDVRVTITHNHQVLVYAFDVFRALDVFTDTIERHSAYPLAAIGVLPAGVNFLDHVVDESHSATLFYPLHRIQQIVRHSPADPTLVDELLTWLGDAIADLIAPPVRRLPERNSSEPQAPAEPSTFSIGRAARILSRDPALTYGQQTLFDAMSRFGWIARELGIWVPAEQTIAEGWLVRHQVRLGYEKRSERVLYPQIRITSAGLTELHTRLGGIATLNLEEQPTLTILDGTA